MAKFLTDRSESILQDLIREWRSGSFGSSGSKPTKRQIPAIQEIAIGVTDEAISPDGSGDATKWTVTGGAFAATSPAETLEVWDFLGNGIAEDTRVVLARMAHADGTRWVAIPAASLGLIRVELDDTLAQGGSADATIVEWNGTIWDDTGAVIEVWDSLNRFSGEIGDRFWVVFQADSSRFEIVSPGESAAATRIWASMISGDVATTASGEADITNYDGTDSDSAGVTVNASTGVLTIQTAGKYLIEWRGSAIYNGTLGGVGDSVSDSGVGIFAYRNGSILPVANPEVHLLVLGGAAAKVHMSYHATFSLSVSDTLKLRYFPSDIVGNSDFNNVCSDVCLWIEKID